MIATSKDTTALSFEPAPENYAVAVDIGQITGVVREYLEKAADDHALSDVTIEVDVRVIPRRPSNTPWSLGYTSLEHYHEVRRDFGRDHSE